MHSQVMIWSCLPHSAIAPKYFPHSLTRGSFVYGCDCTAGSHGSHSFACPSLLTCYTLRSASIPPTRLGLGYIKRGVTRRCRVPFFLRGIYR